MCEYHPTDNSTVRLTAWAASYDRKTIQSLIDDAPFCHLSAQVDGRPYIQATVHWREDEKLYAHGARKNKMIHAIAKGAEAALAFTHFDGYVLARSAFSHAVAYRSVTLFSTARLVEDLEEKRRLLRLFMERISAGRWDTVRPPTDDELKMTGILEFEIKEVSAKLLLQGQEVMKVMPGGQYEKEADQTFSPWTGIIPYTMVRGERISSSDLAVLREIDNSHPNMR